MPPLEFKFWEPEAFTVSVLRLLNVPLLKTDGAGRGSHRWPCRSCRVRVEESPLWIAIVAPGLMIVCPRAAIVPPFQFNAPLTVTSPAPVERATRERQGAVEGGRRGNG